MGIKTPFATMNGKVIHISELQKGKKGTDYNCYCCTCNEKLTPKLGSKNVWHFAHKTSNCEYTAETALHLLAKQVLEKHKKITIPSLVLHNFEDFHSRDDFRYYKWGNHHEDYEVVICKERTFSFEKVTIEKSIKNIKPDVILYYKGKPLLIEVAVTHFIDEEKEKKIKEQKLSTIEIDLSSMKDKFFEMKIEDFEELIINSVENKKWIYNDKAEKEIVSLIVKNKEEYEVSERIRKEEKEERLKLIEKNKKLRAEKIKHKVKIKEIHAKEKRNSKLWNNVVRSLWINEANIPWFISVDVDDELVFNCHKNIWQAMIFDKFISNKKLRYFSIYRVIKWVKEESKIPLNKEFLYDIHGFESDRKLKGAISSYFYILCEQKFLKFQGKGSYRILVGSYKNIENHKYKEEESRISSVVYTRLVKPKDYSKETMVVEKPRRCMHCGKETIDWCIYHGDKGLCECRDCYLGNGY